MRIGLRHGLIGSLILCSILIPLCSAQSLGPGRSTGVDTSPNNATQERPIGRKNAVLPHRLPGKPSQPPDIEISVSRLGSPELGWNGRHTRHMMSLNFLDEQHLLFTFEMPGLLYRQQNGAEDELDRKIRAFVLVLPSGTVEADSVWNIRVHSNLYRVESLDNGHFFLNDGNDLMQGDADLDLKPALHFPGPLLSWGSDPTGGLLTTLSQDPTEVDKNISLSASGKSSLPRQTRLVLRTINRNTNALLSVVQLPSISTLSVNVSGYLTAERIKGTIWAIKLNHFTGPIEELTRVDSSCTPTARFISTSTIYMETCVGFLPALSILDLATHKHWDRTTPGELLCPLLTASRSGNRFIRETFAGHAWINPSLKCESIDTDGQVISVYDSKNGKVKLTAPATPAVVSGGNISISPSGQRVAIFDAGVIKVFDLSP